MYQAWARIIVTYRAPALDTARTTDPRPRDGLAPAEHAWSGAQTLIDNAATGGSPQLQRLAALAKDTFSVDMAGVSLVDGDRVWFAVNTAVLPKSVSAELVYCHTVVQQHTPLVVPDAQQDPRFRGNPFIDITGMDFYAGHPLTAANGETIGTFCLFNTNPCPEASVSMDALKMLAVQAETELRRYETEPVATGPAGKVQRRLDVVSGGGTPDTMPDLGDPLIRFLRGMAAGSPPGRGPRFCFAPAR